jgi:hypothetical protein
MIPAIAPITRELAAPTLVTLNQATVKEKSQDRDRGQEKVRDEITARDRTKSKGIVKIQVPRRSRAQAMVKGKRTVRAKRMDEAKG